MKINYEPQRARSALHMIVIFLGRNHEASVKNLFTIDEVSAFVINNPTDKQLYLTPHNK